MNRANQHALFQATNQGLLGIRQAELTYYINLNIAFGTQAALIGGFTYGVFTQNQVNDGTGYSNLFQDIYWVSSSGTIAAAVHVILTTMLLQVLGPGLALHGPVGSMARAAEGMRIEQKAIITSFIVMMILFSLSTILSFWAVMSLEAASASTCVWVIACRYYYYYCERIYLRFYWKEEKDYLRREDIFGDNDEEDSYEPPMHDDVQTGNNPLHGVRSTDSRDPNNLLSKPLVASIAANEDNNAKKKSKGFKKFMKNMPFQRKTTNTSTNQSDDEQHNNPPRHVNSNQNIASMIHSQATGTRSVVMEGFLVLQSGNGIRERRYFSLNGLGYMYQYKSRLDYRNNPRAPLSKRPIALGDHYIEVLNSEVDEDVQHEKRSVISTSNTNSTSTKLLFQIKLIPRDVDECDEARPVISDVEDEHTDINHVHRLERILRCDTPEELTIWVETMRDVCPSAFRQS